VEQLASASVLSTQNVSSLPVTAPLGAKPIDVVFLATCPCKLDHYIEE